MSFLEDPEQTAQNYDRLARLPAANPADFGPSIMDGFGDAALKVPQAIGARGALAVTELATPFLEKAAQDFGGRFAQPVTDYLEGQRRIKAQNALETLPDPVRTGVAGQILFGAGVQLPEILGASVLTGTPVGGAAYEAFVQATMRRVQLEAQGVDSDTAATLSSGEGLVAGGAALLPGVIGGRLLPDSLAGRLAYQAGTQAAVNAAMGVSQRAATSAYLRSRGYDAMADQVHPFALAEIATDALVGGAMSPLGLLGHPTPAAAPGARPAARPAPPAAVPAERMGPTADAAMTVNAAGHASIDTVPGVAVDVAGMNAHVDALTKATEDLLVGRPVDVDPHVLDNLLELPPEVRTAQDELGAAARQAEAEWHAEQARTRAADLEAEPPPGPPPARRPEVPADDDPHIARLAPDQQNVLRTMYEAAADRLPVFAARLHALAEALGGQVQLGKIKGTERAVAKILGDYEGNAGRINDLLRATIVVDSPEAAVAALARVLEAFPGEGGKVVNRWADEFAMDGYRDIIAKVNIDGHVGEVQIHVPEMLAAKKELHPLYQEREALTRQLAAEGDRPMTAAEEARFVELSARMREGYEAAAASARKRASVIDTPDLTTDSTEKGAGLPSRQTDGPPPAPTTTGSPSTSQNMQPLGNTGRSADPAIAITSTGIIARPEIPVAATGRQDTVKVGDEYQPVTWAVVDAGDLGASMDKGENQARDRNRAASQAQIAKIASSLDFRLLGDSPLMDFGAPTIAPDGRVIGGNGRVAAIERAYEQQAGEGYASALRAAAAQFGLDPAAFEGVARPVLVRIMGADVNVRQAALASNEGAGLRMSLLEQAGVDAERLPPLEGFFVPESGDLNVPANRDFILAWISGFPGTEQAALVDGMGKLSQEGMLRLRNAVLHKAYGESPTLQRLVESADPGAKNVANALTRVGPVVAAARDAIASGDLHPVDLVPHVLAAVEKFAQTKAEGTKVADFLAQGEMFGASLTPEGRRILEYLDAHARSSKDMADLVAGFYRELERAGNPKEGDFFGAVVPKLDELLDRAIANVEEPASPVLSLFGADDYPGRAGAPISKASQLYQAEGHVEAAERDAPLISSAVNCEQAAA